MRPDTVADRGATSGAVARAIALSLAALVALAGCAGGPAVRDAPADTALTAPAPAGLGAIGAAASGDTVRLGPGSALGEGRVLVLDVYRAASGRTCRHVSRQDGSPVEVVCLRNGGEWTPTRTLGVDSSIVR